MLVFYMSRKTRYENWNNNEHRDIGEKRLLFLHHRSDFWSEVSGLHTVSGKDRVTFTWLNTICELMDATLSWVTKLQDHVTKACHSLLLLTSPSGQTVRIRGIKTVARHHMLISFSINIWWCLHSCHFHWFRSNKRNAVVATWERIEH